LWILILCNHSKYVSTCLLYFFYLAQTFKEHSVKNGLQTYCFFVSLSSPPFGFLYNFLTFFRRTNSKTDFKLTALFSNCQANLSIFLKIYINFFAEQIQKQLINLRLSCINVKYYLIFYSVFILPLPRASLFSSFSAGRDRQP